MEHRLRKAIQHEVNDVAVRIRLKRMGAKKRPFYRLVVADSHDARDGRVIEQLGHYDPMTDPAKISVNPERALTWLQRGATPSDTALWLLKQSGVWEQYSAGKANGARPEGARATEPAPSEAPMKVGSRRKRPAAVERGA